MTAGKRSSAVDAAVALKFLAVNDFEGVRESMRAVARHKRVTVELIHDTQIFDRNDVVYLVYL